MLYRIIDADDLPSLIRAFMDSYELVAPVAHGQGYIFDVIEDPNDVVLDYPTTMASPKKYFLPSEETLFKFDVAENDVVDFELDVKPRVLFGVHPCDLNAIERLDAVFLDSRYCDPYYRARREATLIVGVGCMPTASCFCHRVDADEAPRGYDLFLQDLGDRYWVSISSVAAAEILEESTHLREATDDDRAAFARRHASPHGRFRRLHSPCAGYRHADGHLPFRFVLGGNRLAVPELHGMRRGMPDLHVLRHQRHPFSRCQARRARAHVGLLHEPGIRPGGRRA